MTGHITNIIRLVPLFGLVAWSGCSLATHVNDFEVMEPELQECLETPGLYQSYSEECGYCRCSTCAAELKACDVGCWEIVVCSVLNGCEKTQNISACVADKCKKVLDNSKGSVTRTSELANCMAECNDVCVTK